MVVVVRRSVLSVYSTPMISFIRSNSDSTTKSILEDNSNIDHNMHEKSDEVVQKSFIVSPREGSKSLSGFGKAFVKLSKLVSQPSLDEQNLKFTTLLRYSKLMQVLNLIIC